MIFTTINNDLVSTITGVETLSNKFGILGVSISDLSNAYKAHGLAGIKNVISSGITDMDISMLENYNNAVKNGVPMNQALEETMIGCSDAAKKLALEADGGVVKLDGLKKSANTSKLAMTGLKIATVALNTALSMGLSFAIQKVVECLDKLIVTSEEAQEEAIARAESSKKVADEAKEEYETITELIQKYEELAKSETQDSTTRSEIKNIQDEIVNLVGNQVDGLDLVNGRLEDQLKLLRGIAYYNEDSFSSKEVSAAIDAYNDAKKATEDFDVQSGNAVMDLFTKDWSKITVDSNSKDRQKMIDLIDKEFKKNGYGDAYVEQVEDLFGFGDTYEVLEFDNDLDMSEKLDALRSAINVLESNGYRKDKLYSQLVDMEKQLTGADGIFDKQVSAANDVLEALVQHNDAGVVVDSYDDYLDHRNELIKQIADDETIKEIIGDGILTDDGIITYIDNYLGSLSKYEEYYEEWYNEVASDTVKGVKEIKEKVAGAGLVGYFGSPLIKLITGSEEVEARDYIDGANKFINWIDGLTQEEQGYVYKIYCTPDFAPSGFSVEEWEKALADFITTQIGIPEEDKISFSDLIADEEFTQSIDDHIEKVKSLQDVYQSLQEGKEIDLPKLFEEFPELANDADNLDVAISGLLEVMTSNILTVFKSQFGNLKTDEDVTALTNYMNAVLELSKVSESATEDTADFVDVIDSFNASNDILKTAEKEMENGGGISVDTIESLKNITEDYLDYLYVENGLIKLNTDAWRERNEAEKEGNISDIEAQIVSLQEEKRTLEENLEAWKQAKDALDARGESTTSAVDEIANITEELETNGKAIAELEHLLELLRNALADAKVEADAFTDSFVDALSKIQNLSGGFGLLDEIYADVYNGEDFDWSSILNNDNFVEVFGDLGDAYTDFIKTVANSPSDIESCQHAFDNLATAYIRNSKALDGLTEENRDWAVSYLEQEGIANAAAIVDAKLAYNKERLKYTTGEYADATYDEIDALYQECKSGTLTQQVLAELAAEKLLINDNGIKTSSDIEQLIAYANSANATTASLERLLAVKELYLRSEQLDPYINAPDATADFIEAALDHQAKLLAQAQALLTTPLEYDEIDPSKFKAEYAGGSSTTKEKEDSGNSDSLKNEETWFKKQYARHNHLVAKSQESDADYLAWLETAYKKAYDEGIIDLNDYYKYCEEVYEGLQELFKDHLSDVEHEISMRGNYDGESDKIISLYEGLMKDVEAEIKKARSQGLTNEDDYIQELQSKWQEYNSSIKDIRDEATANAKDAIDELIDYRIDMLKQDVDKEKEALDKKLDNLKEFYDKQKEMLQDQYDEEKYLEEQSEKRKSVSDIQAELAMLERDDSAWAQKRKLELQEELSTAQKELGDFEDEHALQLALDALDNAYNEQEAQIQAEMDALEETLNDPEALYNQALADIKNNTGNLYQEMLEYNRRNGTGNDDDVKEIYEEAYKALQEYKDIYGKDYEGVVLVNSTNYKQNTGSWDKEVISGTGLNSNTTSQSTQTSTKSSSQVSSSQSQSTPKSPSLSNGSTVTIKDSATNFGSKSNGLKMSKYVPGGTYTVYGTSGDQVLIGRDGVYTGWVNKTDIVGYASGTSNATAGLHRLDEIGAEYLFSSKDGNKYRVLSSGDKVLNADATNFLYKFANSGGEVLSKIIKSALGSNLFGNIRHIAATNEITMGDIIIKGDTNQRTVSEIRRAQRENLSDMLKSLNKLNK